MKLSFKIKRVLAIVPRLVYPSLFLWYRRYAYAEMARTDNPDLGMHFVVGFPFIFVLSLIIPLAGVVLIEYATKKQTQELDTYMYPIGAEVSHAWFHITYVLCFVFLALHYL